MNRFPPAFAALVLVLALLVQSAPLCCLTFHATPVGDAHAAAGHHSPASGADGGFGPGAQECASSITSFTGLRVQSRLAALEAPTPPSAGPVPVRLASFSVVSAPQRVDHPQKVGPPPYLPLRL